VADFTLQENPALNGADIGQVKLVVCPSEPITSIAPFIGQLDAVNDVLKLHRIKMPKVGAVSSGKNLSILWVGQDQWLALGAPDMFFENLHGIAALTDQSDAWVALHLSGEDAASIMARLTPVDMSALSVGHCARSEYAHMPSVLVPVSDGYKIMVPRSFAQTAVDKTVGAMRRLAGQRVL